MFSRYQVDSGSTHCWILSMTGCVLSRIYHFEDFTCILPLSIDSGKTHQKSPSHTVLRIFCKSVWQIFKAGCTSTTVSVPSSELGLPTPSPVSLTGCGSLNSDDWRKGLTLCLLCGLSKIREKYIKKGIKNWPQLSMYTTGIEKKSYTCHPCIEFLTPVATWSGQYTWKVV
jgi:hypothetical protein